MKFKITYLQGLTFFVCLTTLLTILFLSGFLILKLLLLFAGAGSLALSWWQQNKSGLFAEKPGYKAQLVRNLNLVSLLLLLTIINLLAIKFEWIVDVTENQIFSLSPSTEEVLAKTKEEVEVLGFFKKYTPRAGRFDSFMEKVSRLNTKITARLIDPDIDLVTTRKYGISRYDALVMRHGEQWILVDTFSEEEFVNGLWRLLRKKEKSVCWATGQKEVASKDNNQWGGMLFAEGLEKIGYRIEEIFMPLVSQIPDRCFFLALIGPQAPYSEESLGVIKTYLEAEGRLLLLLDPEHDAGLKPLLKEWGFHLPEALIADDYNRFEQGQPTIPITQNFVQHLITEGLDTFVFFPQARPLEIHPTQTTDAEYLYLVSSSDQSWAEYNLDQSPPLYQEASDARGPHPILILASFAKGGRLILGGDSDFLKNSYIQKAANQDLALNIAKWLARDEDYITIARRARPESKFYLSAAQMQKIKFFSLYGLPGLSFVGCLWIWRRRK